MSNMKTSNVKPVTAPTLPVPKGHYSHGTRWNELLFISGQLPFHADGTPAGPSFEEQARAAMANLLAILDAAGGVPADLLKVTVYIVGVAHWGAFNEIYADMLGDIKPARAVVPVPELHHGFLVEIDGVAAISGTQTA